MSHLLKFTNFILEILSSKMIIDGVRIALIDDIKGMHINTSLMSLFGSIIDKSKEYIGF